MRRIGAVVAVAAVMGVASAWAQTTNFTHGVNLAISGTLIPSGVKVDNESLSGNTNPISFVRLQIINGSATNYERWVGQIVGSTTNLYLMETRHVELFTAANVDKFTFSLNGTGPVGTSSNASLMVVGVNSLKIKAGVTNDTFKAKIQGIWLDDPNPTNEAGGEALVSGTLISVKP